MSNEQFNLLARWKLVRQASTNRRLSAGDIAVLIAILDRMNAEGFAWPSLNRIAEDALISRATVVRSVKTLVESGYLERDSGTRIDSNRYRMGRCTDEPTGGRSGEPTGRCTDEPGVGAGVSLEVGARMSLKPTQENIPIEPARLARDKAASADALPQWLDPAAWDLWKRHRGRKLTDLAASMGIKRLETLRCEGHDPAKLIELAVESGWPSFYPRESTRYGAVPVGALPGDQRAAADVHAANEAAIARLKGAA
ncbi:helix-turn-helix domain-containing protein [Pseudoxanthomonas japonensis]|uniref:helix-turn-helix domain-containing protein n=1 Tax=Pseudoxanthomonas japonensis TaxID=69284 RepID=UPI0037493240